MATAVLCFSASCAVAGPRPPAPVAEATAKDAAPPADPGPAVTEVARPSGAVPATALPPPLVIDAGAPPAILESTAIDEDDPLASIDAELARFTRVLASLRAARSDGAQATPPPRAGLDAWDRILARLDGYLDQPPRATPPVQLVRAKLTVETELEADRVAWRLPGSLTARVRSRIAYMEHRIELARQGVLPIPEGRHHARFTWPVDPVVITSDFGWRRDPFHGRRRFHHGLDLEAGTGQLIMAAGEGIVTWADWNGGHGNQIEIAHPGGWTTRYSHLSQILIRDGDSVRPGDPIGLAGATGRATGAHLHFEIWQDGDARDPIEILGEPPIHLDGVAARRAGARGGD
jgi:murein DD-endopeptidase MepM/ murein hydrolase activator NlpD